MIMRDGEDCAGRVQAVAEDLEVLPVVSAVAQIISSSLKKITKQSQTHESPMKTIVLSRIHRNSGRSALSSRSSRSPYAGAASRRASVGGSADSSIGRKVVRSAREAEGG